MWVKQRAHEAVQWQATWVGQRVVWEEQNAEQALIVLYTLVIAVGVAVFLRVAFR